MRGQVKISFRSCYELKSSRNLGRFLIYIALPWPDGQQPYLELNIYVGLVGAGVVLLPFFIISFLFKIGNLANDGYKLGFKLSACQMDPPSILARSSGVIRNSWHHGGPTAPFIHLISAFCFVLTKVFIEAKLIDVGFLSQGECSSRGCEAALALMALVIPTNPCNEQSFGGGWLLFAPSQAHQLTDLGRTF